LFIVVGAIFLAFSLPQDAHAGRKIIFYQSGEDLFVSGPLPAPHDKSPKLAGAKAGYKCQIFGIFWAYLHIWNCQAVAMRGDTYFSDAKLAAAIDSKYQGEMEVGLWTKHGRWALAGVVLVMVVGPFLRRRRRREEEEEPEPAEVGAG
jgi:hypothetical protein